MKTFISDFDGVLADTGTAFAAQWSEILDTTILPCDLTCWKHELCLGINPKLLDEFWDRVWVQQEITPYPGAIEFVKSVKSLGYKFVILTARWKPTAIKSLWQSLRHFNDLADPDDVILCDKNVKKSTLINKYGEDVPQFFIDDYVKNVADVKINCPTMKEVFLFNRPWNQSKDLLGYSRITSYHEVISRLSKESP